MKSIRIVLNVALILPLLFVSTVWAQNADNSEMNKRLEQRKNKLQTRLTEFQQQAVKQNCKAAQGKVKAVQGRLNGRAAERVPSYNGALERLGSLSVGLKTGGVDTTTLDTQVGELQTMVQNYSEGFAEFKQQIDDMVAIDCEADPEGFRATLLEARAKRTLLVQTANDIQSFLATKIKPTLLTVRQDLANKQGQSNPGGQ